VNIATDPDYDSQLISEMIEPVPNNHLPLHNIYKHEVFQLETSRGPDKLPYWFFRYAASDITAVVSRLIWLTLQNSTLPVACKWPFSTLVPKVTSPQNFSGLSLISVTPIFLWVELKNLLYVNTLFLFFCLNC